MDASKPAKVKAFLSQLPERMAHKLLMALERDKLAGGKELPHGMLLEGLRPTIIAADKRVGRTPTPMRLFCLPFEDLLVGPRRVKREGLIARGTLTPVWEWLAAEVMPDSFRKLYDGLTEAILKSDTEASEQIAAELHAAAGHAMVEAFQSAPKGSAAYDTLCETLGGEDAIADAHDIANVLLAAPEVMQLREALPDGTPSLSPEHLSELRSRYDAVTQSAPDSARYLVVVGMRRLTRPWEILRAGTVISKRDDDSLMSRTDLAIIGDLLFGEMEDCAHFFAHQEARTFDAENALDELIKYTKYVTGIAYELDLIKDGPWDKRLRSIKRGVADSLESIIRKVPEQINKTMPVRSFGSQAARKMRRPDLSSEPDTQSLERAVQLATFLRESRPIAAAAAVAAVHGEVYDVVLEDLNGYREGLLSELRNFDDSDMLSRARAFLDLTVEMTAILVSEGEAQIFRRKGALAERSDRMAAG